MLIEIGGMIFELRPKKGCWANKIQHFDKKIKF